jgi:ribosomal protein L34E
MGDLVKSVRAAARAVKTEPRDAAVLALAVQYAERLDKEHKCADCGRGLDADLAKIGPALLAALEALQLSPRARRQVKTHGAAPVTNPLDQLAERRAGKSRAAGLHSPEP